MARPKGSKNKQSPGLSFNKRMKVLQTIINDSSQKTCDRLSAIKTMTDMLSDKVKENTMENPLTTIKFEENIDKKPKCNTSNTSNTCNTSNTETKVEEKVQKPQSIDNKQITNTNAKVENKEINENEFTIGFNIQEDDDAGFIDVK